MIKDILSGLSYRPMKISGGKGGLLLEGFRGDLCGAIKYSSIYLYYVRKESAGKMATAKALGL